MPSSKASPSTTIPSPAPRRSRPALTPRPGMGNSDQTRRRGRDAKSPPGMPGGLFAASPMPGNGLEAQAHAVDDDVLGAALTAEDPAEAIVVFETEIGERDRRPDQIDLGHDHILV